MMYLARGQVAFLKCVESINDLASAHLFSVAWLSMLHCLFPVLHSGRIRLASFQCAKSVILCPGDFLNIQISGHHPPEILIYTVCVASCGGGGLGVCKSIP